MPSDSELFSELTSKAMLLLRREREVSTLRLERTRIELWIKVFHKLSLNLSVKTPASLLQEWTEFLVEELTFQVAAVYAPSESAKSLLLQFSQSHLPLKPEIEIDADARCFLTANPSGSYRKGAPFVLDEFASSAGFDTFFWLRLTIRMQELLLLCGFGSGAGKSQRLNDYDFSHFELSGKHLAALLENIRLIGELAGERSELAQSNSQLEQAMSQLRREMSERLQLERELRHSQKLEALGRMVAGIGHEINNPLAYMLSNLEYARCEVATNPGELGDARWSAIRDALEEAVAGGERIRSIVSATREFSRPLEEPPKAVELSNSFAAARRIVSNELRHRAKYSETLGDLPHVVADPHRLEQVFVNLLMNAIHALPQGEVNNEINVACAQEDEVYVVVRIADTGHGVSEADLERVFEPFFSTRANGVGLGLGLWICRGIVESFGGRIELTSRLGFGTTVSVYLRVAPTSVAAETAMQQSILPQSRSSWRSARILLIDDEPAVLRGLARVLKGHEILTSVGGRECIDVYKSGSFDIVFCDVMMPGFSGMDFVQELEKLGPEHVRRVVLMTGGVVNDAIRDFLEKAGVDCVSKPFETSQLRKLIRKHLAPSATAPGEGKPA